ncbi:hypothetical protein HPP92_017701 [Vanilla planifolia]|uniref:GRF-type domain-containing protein n=1 Tax=Vanilla planifolia TaxID=51239 RepID=A0A835UNQ5_VANPL|nr:hypothetical protein HPP92_017701 [Vanilla planifolia]
MAALRGSRSSLWQRRQQEVGFQKKGSGGTSYGVGSRALSLLLPWPLVVEEMYASSVACQVTGRGNGGGQGASTNRTDELGEEKPCPCGSGTCLILTSNTSKNPGRRFYRCPLKVENGGCNFFQWCDIPSSDISPSVMAYQSNTLPPVLRCPCGAGPCLSLVCKAGKNAGQQYYKCPGSEKRHSSDKEACRLLTSIVCWEFHSSPKILFVADENESVCLWEWLQSSVRRNKLKLVLKLHFKVMVSAFMEDSEIVLIDSWGTNSQDIAEEYNKLFRRTSIIWPTCPSPNLKRLEWGR